MAISYLRSNNGNRRDWRLLTPVEWIRDGFKIRFAEGVPRIVDSEVEELIERFSKMKGGIPSYEKTGYRSLELDLENRIATLKVSNDSWKACMGTNENPEFFDVMVKRFNRMHNTQLTLDDAFKSVEFFDFAGNYSANALSQCHALLTKSGVPIGERSGQVEVEQHAWHVIGTYFQGIGTDIYKKPIPKHNGVPVTNIEKFGSSPESITECHLKAHAICNICEESGNILVPYPDDIKYLGIVHEISNNNVELIGLVRARVSKIGKDWEHDRMVHVPVEDLPEFTASKAMVPAGQAAVVMAYAHEKGLERIREDFSFVVR